ncbi:MAG: hypothetical protein ABFC80_01790 [Coriobacteriales bacterium]|nr:hypothetical protein [Actinomycetes bacterium]
MRLYDLCRHVSAELEKRYTNDPMGLLRAKGELATRTGFLAGLVGPNDPEDPEKVRRLREAAEAMGIAL